MLKNQFQRISWLIILALLIGSLAMYNFFAAQKTNLKNVQNKNNYIKVYYPQPNQETNSPLVITGEARGFWFFEATFPVKLISEKGDLIIQHYAQAQSDWMTENFVPFEATLNFKISKDQKAFLVLEKDNPSGLPENADEIRIPVFLKANETPQQTVKLYYYNSKLDKDNAGNILCSKKGLVPIDRQIPLTKTPIQDTIKLLLEGKLTEQERSQGINTEYPLEGLALKGASLKNGILTLEFDDPKNKTNGGSCRVGILWFQIEQTAKQFPEVKQIKFLPEELFQP